MTVGVGDVAHELGIDHSGASRFVAAAITDGYLSRGPSSGDRRRVALVVSRSGHELLVDAREWQERAFRRLTEGWPADDAAQFAGHLRRLAGELAAER